MSQEELEAHVSHGPRATIIAPGVTLFTKDGSNTGNAIVVRKVGQVRNWLKIVEDTNAGNLPKEIPMLDMWECETDFGNRFRLSTAEIEQGYWLGYQQDYDKWWDERLELIKKSVQP